LLSDDGAQSELAVIYTGLNRTVEIQAITGRNYRFQYRVANALGWSDLSSSVTILAAEAPSKPVERPELVSVDLTQITIRLG
jgi:hypothetical protein